MRLSENLETAEFVTRVGLPMSGVDISPTAFLVSDCDEMYISGWGGQRTRPTAPMLPNPPPVDCPRPKARSSLARRSDFGWGASHRTGDLTYGTYWRAVFERTRGRRHLALDKNGTVYKRFARAVADGMISHNHGRLVHDQRRGQLQPRGVQIQPGLVADIEIEAPDLIAPGIRFNSSTTALAARNTSGRLGI